MLNQSVSGRYIKEMCDPVKKQNLRTIIIEHP